MEIKRITVPFTKEDTPDDTGKFKGYGSTFGNVDLGGDVVEKGAFEESLAEWAKQGELPLMPWFHDLMTPVGDWLEMSEDSKGLKTDGQVWVGEKKTDASQMVHNFLTGTGPKNLSIGFVIPKNGSLWEDDKKKGSIRRLIKIGLMEVSVVPFPMNPKAKITQAKNLIIDGEIAKPNAFEKVLRDAGLSNAQARRFMHGGYSELLRDAEVDDVKLQETLASLARLQKHIQKG